MSEESRQSLEQHIRAWIARQATEEVAERFYPWVRKTLSVSGYDLSAPASEERVEETKENLRQADITPARMQRALREARRAKEEGLSAMEWIESVQRRAHSEELAEGASFLARKQLKEEFGEDEADLQQPPTPEETFAFLLAWEDLGGSSGLAALREMQRQAEDGLSQN